jgi:hypothetical protein
LDILEDIPNTLEQLGSGLDNVWDSIQNTATSKELRGVKTQLASITSATAKVATGDAMEKINADVILVKEKIDNRAADLKTLSSHTYASGMFESLDDTLTNIFFCEG